MSGRFPCPECTTPSYVTCNSHRQPYKDRLTAMGRKRRCPKCGHKFTTFEVSEAALRNLMGEFDE